MNGFGNDMDRVVPQYIVPSGTTLINWVKENPAELCKRILESARWAQDIPAENIPVLMLVEPTGVHLFQIGMRDGIIESLEKSQEYFVKVEEYEEAAECRDLIQHYRNEITARQNAHDGFWE